MVKMVHLRNMLSMQMVSERGTNETLTTSALGTLDVPYLHLFGWFALWLQIRCWSSLKVGGMLAVNNI